MKVAVTSTGDSLDAAVDPRFGRAAWFVLVDTDTMEWEAVANPNTAVGGGAGIQSGQLMVDRGVEAVITGNCGPNAFRVLEAAGIQVCIGASGSVRDAVQAFSEGKLERLSAANVDQHFGMGGGGGGMGFGRRGGF